MNLWSVSERKWAQESESKSEIEEKHLHHEDISNYVIYTTNSHGHKQSPSMKRKCWLLLKYMNLWSVSERKWAQESESKSEIEEKHLHHEDISNYVIYTTNSHGH